MSDDGQVLASDAALLIIDVQRALFDKKTPVFRAADLLHNITRLMNQAHQAGVPVIFFQHANTSFLAEGSDGWQLHPDLAPSPDDLRLHKQHGSAFQDTPLHAELQARGVTTLVLTGLVTNGCIRATCEAALKQSYRVLLVTDAHSTYHKDAAAIVPEWNQKLSEAGAELVTTAEVVFAGQPSE